MAATDTWNGGGSPDFNWSNSANWDTLPSTNGDSLIFAGSTGLLNTNDYVTSLGANSITFDATAGSFVLLGSQQITAGSGGNDTFITQNSASDQTIALPIKLAGGQHDRHIIMNGSGTLNLVGNIDFANDWLFPNTAAGTIVLSGNNSGDGKGGVLNAGSNTARAMMRNNVSGTALELGSDTALGNSGSGDVGAGTANFRGLVANQNMTISTTGNDQNLSGSTIIINTANVTYDGANNFMIGNLIDQGGNRDFWVTSSGTVTVQNSLCLSSDQTGYNLYVNLTGTGGMVVNGKIYDSFNPAGLTSGQGELRKAGTGTMTLNGDSTYTNLTTVEGGTLVIGNDNALGATGTASGTIISGGSSTLDLNGHTIGESLTFNNSGNTLANSGTNAAAVTADATLNGDITVNTTGDITVARLIAGAPRTVTKTGAGTLTLDGAGHNNLVGLKIQGGTVICANNGGFSADRGFELDYGTNILDGPGRGSYPNADLINDGEPFYLFYSSAYGPSVFDLNGWNETVGTVYGNAGATILNNASGTSRTLAVGGDNGTATLGNTFSGTAEDGAGVLGIGKTGTGVQIFNGTSTYSGDTTIGDGQFEVTASGASPNSTYVVNTNGGLTFTTDTAFMLGGLAGSGDVSLLSDGYSPIALTVGANNASTTYSGALTDGGAGATLIKVGTGTLTLAGTNDYSGLTTVSNGVLVISPDYVAGHDFTVNEGAVLGVSGNTAATSAQIGNLTNGISGTGSSTLLFTDLPYPANAPLTVNTLNPVGGAGSVIVSNNAVLSVGTYNLINYTNLAGTGFSAFALQTLPPGTTAYLSNNITATPKVIQMVVTAVAPQIWSGAVDTNWDIATTPNWTLNSAATTYHDGSPALFNDNVGSGYTLVNLAANVEPSDVTVSNITKVYTFTTANGSGITGTASFTKDGAGTLTLANVTNTFSGGAVINAGTVVLSSATLGTGDIMDNASLVFGGTQTASNTISGTGTLTKNGTGLLTLTASNSYTGGTTLAAGSVLLPVGSSSPFGTGTLTISNDTTLIVQGDSGSGGVLLEHDVAVPAGASTLIDNSANSYGNLWIGSDTAQWTGFGTVNFQNNGANLWTAVLWSGNPLTSFQGTINIGSTNSAHGMFNGFGYNGSNGEFTSPATFDASGVAWQLGNVGFTRNFAIYSCSLVKLGSISASNPATEIRGNVNPGGACTYEIGALNTSTTFAGMITSNAGPVSLTKVGTGTLTLTGTNNYTGDTTINGGTLELAQSFPTLDTNSVVTIASGAQLKLTDSGVINQVASLVTNGVAAANGLYTSANSSGFIAGAGSLQVGAVVGPTSPGTITNSYNPSTGELSLSWPANQGWRLQMQTNSLSDGLGTNWEYITDGTVSSTNITVDPTKPTVFYRLKYQ